MDIRPTGNLPESVTFEKFAQISQKESTGQPIKDQVIIGQEPPPQEPPPQEPPEQPPQQPPPQEPPQPPPQPPPGPVTKKWTFLHYGAGDNNLSRYIYGDVDEMESVGSDANTNIVTQLDQSSGTCKRIYLVKDDRPGIITSPTVEDLGSKVNMADPKTLTAFLVWGMTKYPANHVALSIGDHGGGTDGAIADDRDGGYGMMKPADIEKAIKEAEKITGKRLDILAFDCCLMANTEVAYQLKDTADYLVASEESEGAAGWPYNKVLREEVLKQLQEALKNKINVGPRDFAAKVVKDASTVQGDLPTMSAVELAKMGEVGKKMDSFSQAILDTTTPMSDIKSLVYKTQSFSGFKDIYDFAQKITQSEKIKDEDLKNSAREVMASIKQAVIAEQHSSRYPGAHGLQIKLNTWGSPGSAYYELAFAKDTKWAQAMEKIAKATANIEPSEIPDGPGSGYPDYEFPGIGYYSQ